MRHPASPLGAPFKRRRSQPLSALVPDSVAPVLKQRGFASAALLTDWAEIVGPAIAHWTAPLEIRWPKRLADAANSRDAVSSAAYRSRKQENTEKATLLIACPGAFALDVQMATPRIIEAINRRLGFACIGTIKINQVPRPAPVVVPPPLKDDPAMIKAVSRTMGNIHDEHLRLALAKMGANVLTKNQRVDEK